MYFIKILCDLYIRRVAVAYFPKKVIIGQKSRLLFTETQVGNSATCAGPRRKPVAVCKKLWTWAGFHLLILMPPEILAFFKLTK